MAIRRTRIKVTLIVVIGLLLLALASCYFLNRINEFSAVVSRSWGIQLPRSYEIIYHADNKAGFFGEGDQYHILHYLDGIDSAFLDDFSADSSSAPEANIYEIVNRLDVQQEHLIDFSQPYQWKENTFSPPSREDWVTKAIYMIYFPDDKLLYVIQMMT